MKELVVATRNHGKLRELHSLLDGIVDTLLNSADFPDFPETIEDGLTFQANALKKAREAMRFTGLPALADDSGLAVDALDGRPGVYSARFAGEGAGDSANNLRLLEELAAVPAGQRQAAFICVVAYVTPDGVEQTFSGRINGCILDSAQGDGGFGYDPLFLVDGYNRTMAELTLPEKNAISHRGQALRSFRAFLEQR